MNKFEKYFNEYYSNASFVRWYTENLAMIREQYQREVVESFLFVNKLSLQEKKFYDFQITYHFEYFPNKQGKIVRQYHGFELHYITMIQNLVILKVKFLILTNLYIG